MTQMRTAGERPAAEGEARLRSVGFITFILRFTESGGVTVPDAGETSAGLSRERVQARLDRDPEGTVVLPGTSVAGALREMIRCARGEDVATDLLGPLAESASLMPSKIIVLGSRGLDDGSDVRAATAIDRERAAARQNTLRAEEVLPAGARFEVFLRWDDPPDGAMAGLAGLLAVWRPFLGRGISRGRGACVVEVARHGTLRLDDPAGLLRWLTMSGPELARAVAVTEVRGAADEEPEPVLRVDVSITGPWRSGNGEEPGDGEPIPLLRVGGVPTVPGSSIKGVLRSRAEFILRSVGVTPGPCLDQRCGQCWPCQVFGHGGGADEGAKTVGARSVIRIPDAAIRDPVLVSRTHVAIDRFTGGALPGALYTMEAVEAGTFTIGADALVPIGQEQLRRIRAVLRLVLEDLDGGIIGMGGGVARGYGTVTVEFGSASPLPALAEAQQVLREMEGGT